MASADEPVRVFAADVGKLVDAVRRREPRHAALRQLQAVLETVRLVVGRESNSAEIRTAAVELRAALDQLYDAPAGDGNEGAARTQEVLAAVASIVAAVKYQLSQLAVAPATPTLPRPSINEPSSSTVAGDAALKESVETFVRKCSEILVHSRDAAMQREPIVHRFIEVMDSLKRIAALPGIDAAAIKGAAAPLVAFVRQMTAPDGYDADARRQLSALVLGLARTVKAAVNAHLQAELGRREPGAAQPHPQQQMSIAFQRDQETGEERLRLQTSDEVKQPLGFTHFIPVVGAHRARLNTDNSVSSQTSADHAQPEPEPQRRVNVLRVPDAQHRRSRYISASGQALDLRAADSETFLRAKGLADVATTIGLCVASTDGAEDESVLQLSVPSDPSPLVQSIPPPPTKTPEIAASPRAAVRSPSQESMDDVPADKGRASDGSALDDSETDMELSMYHTPHVWSSDEAKRWHTQQVSVAASSDIAQPGNSQLASAVQFLYSSIKKRVLKPKTPDGQINIQTMGLVPQPLQQQARRQTNASELSEAAAASPTASQRPAVLESDAAADGAEVEDTVETIENDKVVLVLKVKGSRTLVEAGTVDILVERLANEDAQDHEYMRTFLLAFRHIMKPRELMDKVLERIQVVTPANATPEQLEYFNKWGWRIQYRAINFVKKWMESCWFDFHQDAAMLQSLDTLVALINASPKIQNLAKQIQNARAKQTEAAAAEERRRAQAAQDAVLHGVPVLSNVNMSDFMSMDLNAMGRQMTLIEFDFFRKVQPQELMIYLWGDPRENVKGADLTANLTAYVNRFNQISFWVGTEICIVPTLKKRIAVVERIIQLLKVRSRKRGSLRAHCRQILREFNNFNVVMGIISGLNSASVQRLKKTWEGISSRSLATLHEIEQTMDPASNYRTYRAIELRKYPHFIPFFGLVLKDLIFANDGNPKILPNGLVNFGKLRTLAQLVERLALFQSNPYTIQREDAVHEYCSRLIALSEERLYKYSLLCEPRATNEQQPVRLVDKWNAENIGFIEKWVRDL